MENNYWTSEMNSPARISRILIGGTIGNLTEWYNFLLYGYLASVISQEFFPSKNPLLSLSLVFTVFALSFLARPLGGILFGWIGDKHGRQRALTLSVLLMGIPTFLISVLPTYRDIGVMSPILLSLLRILQGLSAGGEHTGSAVYVAEHAPNHRRSLWVSTVPASAAFGLLVSSIMALVLINSFTEAALLSYGWRVGYWIGSVFCLISFLLRKNMPETPQFAKISQGVEHQRLSTLLQEPSMIKNLLLVFSLASCWGIFYQVLFIWMPTYLTHFKHLDKHIAFRMNSIYLLVLVLLILLVGYGADYVNRKRLVILSSTAMLAFSYPLFILLSSGQIKQIYLGLGLFTLIFSLYLPTTFISMVEAFPTRVRYTGLSLSFNTGLAIFGGTCPLIVTWLIQITDSLVSPAYYLMFAGLLAAVTGLYLHEPLIEMQSTHLDMHRSP